MDADEKLTALKKAYADILFNMSKESAARVMASERKAIRFEHELKVAKEEGVGMLVHLKQMMDSKAREAEAAALNQQAKIEELEAQLHEAEDIVRDLRQELRETQAELERTKLEISKPANEPENFCSREIPVDNRVYSYQHSPFVSPNSQGMCPIAADATLPDASQKNGSRNCCDKAVCVCSSYIGPPGLPSIILRRKGSGLYRNGCTQRIRACERNQLEREECLSGKVVEVKDDENNGDMGGGKDTGKTLAKSLSELEKKLLEGIKIDECESFPQRRKRTIGQRKPFRASRGKQPVSLVETDQLPDQIAPGFSEHKDEGKFQEGEESSEKEINLVESKSEKNVLQKEELIKGVVPAFEFADGGSGGEMEIEKVNAPLDDSQTILSRTTEGIHIGARVIKYTFQRKRKRQVLSGYGMNSSLETETKSGDMPNGHHKLEISSLETEKKSGDKPNGRQNPENSSPETVKKTGNKQNDHQMPEPPLSSLLKKSRESRRMVQVARQLIALSENKRWL